MGKWDQYTTDIPYSAVLASIQSVIKQVDVGTARK